MEQEAMTNLTTDIHRDGASVRFGTPNTEAGSNLTPNLTLQASVERGTEHPTEHTPTEHPPRSRTEHPPRCCATPRDHRPNLSAYWYRAVNGWHCWQCDGRADDGWRRCPR